MKTIYMVHLQQKHTAWRHIMAHASIGTKRKLKYLF